MLGGERIDPPGYAQVNAQVVQQGRNAIALDFRLRQKDNDWKIFDVTVDGISITANYRNQFGRVIEQRGFGQLMGDLRGSSKSWTPYLASGKRSFPVMARESLHRAGPRGTLWRAFQRSTT